MQPYCRAGRIETLSSSSPQPQSPQPSRCPGAPARWWLGARRPGTCRTAAVELLESDHPSMQGLSVRGRTRWWKDSSTSIFPSPSPSSPSPSRRALLPPRNRDIGLAISPPRTSAAVVEVSGQAQPPIVGSSSTTSTATGRGFFPNASFTPTRIQVGAGQACGVDARRNARPQASPCSGLSLAPTLAELMMSPSSEHPRAGWAGCRVG